MVHLDIEAINTKGEIFRPIGSDGWNPRFNYYGFINEGGGDENHGYTQIFRNGILEATKARILREYKGRHCISGMSLEPYIFKSLSTYIVGLRDVGVPPPLIIMFTFDGVFGANYVVYEPSRRGYGLPLPEDLLTLPECVLEDYGADVDHHRAFRPAFDALWNAVGYPRSLFFDDEGRWIGERG